VGLTVKIILYALALGSKPGQKHLHFDTHISAFFAAMPQKIGLSAPSPRNCQCNSCGLSAAIQVAWASSEFANANSRPAPGAKEFLTTLKYKCNYPSIFP
jgi:hypothetical protein